MLLPLLNYFWGHISTYLLSIPAVLITLMVHELSHGWMAYRLGDPTARIMGRLSLNPLKHLDPIGTICLLLFRFGWAKPVPINARYFKKPKLGMALTALAGPLSNLILAFLAIPFFILSLMLSAVLQGGFTATFFTCLYDFFLILHFINIGLAVFNLIPIPPLDGSRVLFAVLPAKAYFSVMRYERYFSIALMLIVFGVARFDFFDIIASKISQAMLSVWFFIPIF